MGSSTISLPPNFGAEIVAFAGNLIASWKEPLELIIGVLLVATVASILISTFWHK